MDFSRRWFWRLRLEALEDQFLPTTVTNLNDSGLGSLRNALVSTPANGQIDFAPGLSGTIVLSTGQLNIVKNVTIDGPGTDVIGVSGNDASTVFGISSASLNVAIKDISIVDGSAAFQGGGILNFGTLSLDNVVVTSSTAVAGGGGIYNGGTLTIHNSQITGNQAGTDINPGTGGGIMNTGLLTVTNSLVLSNITAGGGAGAGVHSANTANFINTVIAGNQSPGNGGGMATFGSLTLFNCTVAGNGATQGGGIFVNSGNGSLKLTNTIVAVNSADSAADVSGAATASTFNLIGNGDGSSGLVNTQGGNQVGTSVTPINPLLGALQFNGSPTLSVAILPGSPAIDAGTNSGAPATDQRGFQRMVNGITDIGAYEHQPPATATTVSSNDNPSSENEQITLTATVQGVAAFSNTPTGTVAFFDGGNVIGTAPLINGVANLPATLSPGVHSITANYQGFAEGDYTLNSSTSPAFSQSVLASSVTVVGIDPAFAFVNQTVTLSATVSGAGPTPTGTVTFFYDGTNQLGTATLSAGVASINVATIPGGAHSITAVYNGDATYADGISSPGNLHVNPVGTSAVVLNAPNKVKVDQTVILTATVTPDLSGAFSPAGTVSFFSDGQLIGAANLVGNTATLQVSTLKVGTHALSAQYDGNNNFLASLSPSVNQTIEAISFFAVGGARDECASPIQMTP